MAPIIFLALVVFGSLVLLFCSSWFFSTMLRLMFQHEALSRFLVYPHFKIRLCAGSIEREFLPVVFW